MSIEFLNESGFEGVNEEMLIDVASYAFGAMDINPDAECTITCVDLKTIEDLHVRWMDLEGPTDVMSFPMDELTPGTDTEPATGMLGDIVLCPEFAQRQANAAALHAFARAGGIPSRAFDLDHYDVPEDAVPRLIAALAAANA